MHFQSTKLPGASLITLEPHQDPRGSFARTFCAREFHRQGLPTTFVQCSASYSTAPGTLRGLHYQTLPSQEAKLVRCIVGAIWDVIVDCRPDSPTYLQHFGIELSAANRKSLFVPPRFAHGYQSLTDNTEVFYQMSDFYAPDLTTGLRWDDPRLGIKWPLPVTAISDKDRSWPLLQQ